MIPERLNFLNEFDRFYQGLVRDIKEDRYNERDFYLIIGAKVKSLDRKRREGLLLLNKKAQLRK